MAVDTILQKEKARELLRPSGVYTKAENNGVILGPLLPFPFVY
jgi:hypothetical protein